ncbi:hypothetical protein [Parafrankia elaeagni]|uniref:hypothetical protein n=1 Tax=Parafrankia elaeagni TaxID=222534 RepID=UPI0012B65CBD|nr:hypothetical protein [Parafrankia elaeagni]
MTNKMGRRTAVLATSGMVSVAVVLGAGAGVAQAAPQGAVAGVHKPEVKKDSISISYERVLWFDNKDKKEHPKEKEWPWYDEAAAGQGGYDDPALGQGPADLEEPDAFVDSVLDSGLAPGIGEPSADPDPSATYGPRDDYKKKYSEISKRKDAISYERVLWFADKDKKEHPKKEWPKHEKDYDEEDYDERDGWSEFDDDSLGYPVDAEDSGAGLGPAAVEPVAVEPAASELAAYGPAAYSPAAYEPVAYKPGYDKHVNLLKKKIRITIERILWFDSKKKHDRHDSNPWSGQQYPYLPEQTSTPLI